LESGEDGVMLAAAIALVVVGVVFLFLIPWVGIPVGAVGLLLLVLYVVGWTRRATHPQP
jgi:Flp pilus assembly protein TadB